MNFIGIILLLAFLIFMIAAIWKTFEKAGQPGWAALIPIYNVYIMTVIAKKPGWWTVLMLIPYIGLIWQIWVTNLIAKNFGKTEGFTIGLIFLPFVFWPILGFGDAQYDGSQSIGTLDDPNAKM
ncbi:MAG: signal peptidase I [Flavobacteriales bacterium]|nr:signal peptidase I [Flavobacteriales bacterium]